MANPNQGAAVWVVATRISVLDVNGFPDAGANAFVTNTPMKVTGAPVVETGDDIAVKNAAGDLAVWARHSDMPKYHMITLDLATPDPLLEQACAGGTVLSDTSAALGVTTGLAAVSQTTLGTLAAGTYGYRATQYNQYGESAAEAEVTAVTTGATSAIVLSGIVMAAGALGARVYGRNPGQEQLLGYFVNIGTQATSAASGTGAVASLSVTGLTKSIPSGYTFQIAGDTNSPKIVWTTTQFAGVGATVLAVSPSQSVTTTIVAGNIVPCFVDSGALTPSGNLPTTDTTAGPGTGTGYGIPVMGTVGNPNGVSIEMWEKRIINGSQAADYPYWRIIYPMVKGMHTLPRDYTNANLQTTMEGQAFQNPNFSTGPMGDWQFASTLGCYRCVWGGPVLPIPSFSAYQQTY